MRASGSNPAGPGTACSHDWAKKYVIGNIKNDKIENIWLSQKYKLARKKLLSAKRNFIPCNKCDVSGELIGSKHASQWKNTKMVEDRRLTKQEMREL